MFYTYDMKKTIFSPCYILRTNILFIASLNAGSGVFWMENSSKRQVLLCKKKLFFDPMEEKKLLQSKIGGVILENTKLEPPLCLHFE